MARFNGVLLLFIIVGASISLVKAVDSTTKLPMPDNFKQYEDDRFTTVEGNIAGVMGRTLEDVYDTYLDDGYRLKQLYLPIRQYNFVGLDFSYNDTDMTAGDISSATQMDWVNVSRAYFGSYAELLNVSRGCSNYTLQVSSSEIPVIITSPEDLKSHAYIESSDMANRILRLCYVGSEATGMVTVWVMPTGSNLIYNSTGDQVKKVAGSKLGVDYTYGRIITEITGGCLVTPFGFDMIFVPFTFVSIEVDVPYLVWVQDASVKGFVVCFKPDDKATEKNVTIHYVATTNFEVKELPARTCSVVFNTVPQFSDRVSAVEALLEAIDVDATAYVSNWGDRVLMYHNSEKCELKYGTAMTMDESAQIFGTAEDITKELEEDFVENDEITIRKLSTAEMADFLACTDLTQDKIDSVTTLVLVSVFHENCEPHGYKKVEEGSSVKYECKFFGAQCESKTLVIPTPVTNNDYSSYAEYVGNDPNATSLKRVEGDSKTANEKVSDDNEIVSSGLQMSGIQLGGLLVLLLSVLTVFL